MRRSLNQGERLRLAPQLFYFNTAASRSQKVTEMMGLAERLHLETLGGKATDDPFNCDFNCGGKDEKLLLLANTNGHRWIYHLSCLKEYLERQGKLDDHNHR